MPMLLTHFVEDAHWKRLEANMIACQPGCCTVAPLLPQPVQRAAEALYSDQGRRQCRVLIDHYMGNARILGEACEQIGLKVYGGENAPYIWVKTPRGLTSWETFDRMLSEINVVITPGAGFGAQGEGYIRISAFNSRENAEEVARRLRKLDRGD